MSTRLLPRQISGPELNWCLRMNRWADVDAIRRFFAVISRLGDGPMWLLLVVLFAWHDLHTGRQVATQLAFVGLSAWLLYRTVKRRTRRLRPYQQYRLITAHVAALDEYSFPSGHTLHAVVFSGVSCLHEPWLAVLLLPMTILIAMSRVILGLHYPSDVLAATGIGGVLIAISYVLFQ